MRKYVFAKFYIWVVFGRQLKWGIVETLVQTRKIRFHERLKMAGYKAASRVLRVGLDSHSILGDWSMRAIEEGGGVHSTFSM